MNSIHLYVDSGFLLFIIQLQSLQLYYEKFIVWTMKYELWFANYYLVDWYEYTKKKKIKKFNKKNDAIIKWKKNTTKKETSDNKLN